MECSIVSMAKTGTDLRHSIRRRRQQRRRRRPQLPLYVHLLLGMTATSAHRSGPKLPRWPAGPAGEVYFGTLSSGTIYRWTEKEGTVALYPSPQQSIFALRLAADGELFAASGDKGIVYELWPARNPGDVRAARVLEPNQLQSTSLALSPNGDLLVGTGNNAAAFRMALSATAPLIALKAAPTPRPCARRQKHRATGARYGPPAMPPSRRAPATPRLPDAHLERLAAGLAQRPGRDRHRVAERALFAISRQTWRMPNPAADTPALTRHRNRLSRPTTCPRRLQFVVPRPRAAGVPERQANFHLDGHRPQHGPVDLSLVAVHRQRQNLEVALTLDRRQNQYCTKLDTAEIRRTGPIGPK